MLSKNASSNSNIYLIVKKYVTLPIIFACMTAMLLDHRLDSAREVHLSTFVSKSDTIVSIHIALQSYNEIDSTDT